MFGVIGYGRLGLGGEKGQNCHKQCQFVSCQSSRDHLSPLPATNVLSYHKYQSSYIATPSMSHMIFPFWAALTLVKPTNFIMGIDKSSSVINVIDFGLVKGFRDLWTMMHIPLPTRQTAESEHPFSCHYIPTTALVR